MGNYRYLYFFLISFSPEPPLLTLGTIKVTRAYSGTSHIDTNKGGQDKLQQQTLTQ